MRTGRWREGRTGGWWWCFVGWWCVVARSICMCVALVAQWCTAASWTSASGWPRARSDDQSRDMQFAIIQVDVNSVLYHSYACQQSCRCYRRSVHVGRSAMRSIDMSITRFFRSDKHGPFIAAYTSTNSIGTLRVILCSCCNVCDAPFGPTH